MLTYREGSDPPIVDIIVDGKADQALFEEMTHHIEETMAHHHAVRLYEELRTVRASEPSIFLNRMKLSLRRLPGNSRCAIVADEAWFGWMVRTIRPDLSCEIRYFTRKRRAAARAWLRSEPGPVVGQPTRFGGAFEQRSDRTSRRPSS